jgi:membrane protein insertase Oxa1/YidC/SpoIIIJ
MYKYRSKCRSLPFGSCSAHYKLRAQKKYDNNCVRLVSNLVGNHLTEVFCDFNLPGCNESRNDYISSSLSYYQLRTYHSHLRGRHATNIWKANSILIPTGINNRKHNINASFTVVDFVKRPLAFNYNRHISSSVTIWPSSWPIWGGSGYVINILHDSLGIPYWGTFVLLSIGVRFMLIPAVIWGAHTSSQFGKALPDIVFLFQLCRSDMKHLKSKGYPLPYRLRIVWSGVMSFKALCILHKVRPYAIFLSPLLQTPIFYYLSVDMRKICNGSDLTLAQNLVDANVFNWITDLTDPDPWFALPITCGVILYGNMEIALGKHNLVAAANNTREEPVNAEERKKQADAKATGYNTSLIMKDVFQTLAIFMPCVTCNMPAGVQIYVTTSFLFTSGQSFALRNDKVRQLIGLPSLSAPKPDIVYAKLLIDELEALKLKGEKIESKKAPGTVDTAAIKSLQSDANCVGVTDDISQSISNNGLLANKKSNTLKLTQKRFSKQMLRKMKKQWTKKR